MDSIKKQLKLVECPMNWNLTALRECSKPDRIVERLKDRLEENSIGETWKTLTVMLFLAFELYMGEESTTFDIIKYFRQSADVVEKDWFLRKYRSAAEHILYGMWAHGIYKMDSQRQEFHPQQTLSHLRKIIPYQEMTEEETAFILATKASFHMMYGPPGNPEALKLLSEVLKLNQDEPEWWYLKGKCLARMRRLHYRSTPTKDETAAFEKAVEMDENCSRYLIHLARSKADRSSQLRHNRTELQDLKVLEALNTDVESLLRKAVSLKVESSHLICHIAKSFMKLPHFFRVRNRNLTKFCVIEAVRKSPTDPLVNHTVGLYCLTQSDIESAVYYLTEASNMGVYGASFDLCRLKWKEYDKYDPVPDLTDVIKTNDRHACSEAHGLLATYYFFAKNDLRSAIDHWKMWEHSREKKSYLITSIFLGQESFDFNSALYDEVRLEMSSTRYNNSDDRLRLNEVVQIIQENRPELKLEEPRRQRQHLIDKAQMVSKVGRAYPDSLLFMKREQVRELKAQKEKKTLGSTEVVEISNRQGKRRNVSSKNNGYRRFKTKNDANDPKGEMRSQSATRAQEFDRKPFEKPFWRPPRRHRSMECLNKHKNAWSGSDEKKNDGSGNVDRNDATSSTERRKHVGSGRIHCFSKCNLSQVKAVSMESLILVKSYEPKKTSHRKEQHYNSGFNSRRSCSQESLVSNRSTEKEVFEKRTFGSTRTNPDEAEKKEHNSGRYTSSRDMNSDRPSRPPSICEDVPTSVQSGVAETCSDWRRNEGAGADLASPKSSYFSRWANRDQRDNRSSSRASSVSEESSWNRECGNNPTSSTRTSFREGGAPTSASFQPRNRLDEENRLGSSSQGVSARTYSRPSFQGRDDTPKSSFFQSKGQGDRTGLSRNEQSDSVRTFSRPQRFGNAPTSSFQSWSQSGQRDRVKSSSRSPLEEECRNDWRPSGDSRESSRISTGRPENFLPRFRGREGYTPRGGSFSRNGQRDPRKENASFRQGGNDIFDSLRRLEMGKR